ncbi:Riboflavin ECF transporter S component FmnP, partial [Dysosmobacter welbionis]
MPSGRRLWPPDSTAASCRPAGRGFSRSAPPPADRVRGAPPCSIPPGAPSPHRGYSAPATGHTGPGGLSSYPREAEHHAHHGRGGDEHDGMEILRGFHPIGQCQQHRRQDQARPADEARQAAVPQLELVEQPRLRRRHHDVGEHLKYHGHAGRADQARRGRPQSVEGPVHISVLPEVPQQGGNNQDHDDGGRHLSQCGDHRAGDTGNGEAHIGGHVDADGAGGGLGHRQHVHELGL